MTQQEQYWKELAEAAMTYIDKCPCDPDITPEQLTAWNELLAKREEIPPTKAQGVEEAANDYADDAIGQDYSSELEDDFNDIKRHFIAGSRWQQGHEAERERLFKSDPVNFLFSNAMRYLNKAQLISLRDALIERTPKAAPPCCARWVKASERLPEESKHKQWYVVRQSNNTRSARTYWWDMISKDIEQFVKLPLHNIEWLDESAAEQGMDDSISGFIGDKKKGSKWVIQDCINGHQFEIGTIVTIIAVDEEDYYATDGKKSWYVRDNEISHINSIK